MAWQCLCLFQIRIVAFDENLRKQFHELIRRDAKRNTRGEDSDTIKQDYRYEYTESKCNFVFYYYNYYTCSLTTIRPTTTVIIVIHLGLRVNLSMKSDGRSRDLRCIRLPVYSPATSFSEISSYFSLSYQTISSTVLCYNVSLLWNFLLDNLRPFSSQKQTCQHFCYRQPSAKLLSVGISYSV